MIHRGHARRRPPLRADRIIAPSVRRLSRSAMAREWAREFAYDVIGEYAASGFEPNTDYGGRWFPQVGDECITACRLVPVSQGRAQGYERDDAKTATGELATWPITREGAQRAVVWCEAANATIPKRKAVWL